MYKDILVAIEFSELAYLAGKKAVEMAKAFQANLSLIHVVELPSIDIFPDIPNKEKLYLDEAKSKLLSIGKSLQIKEENLHLEVGNPCIEIPEFVEKHNLDLLMVGHNERKGLDRILGSTAYALLEKVKCSVLVVPFSSK